jgi:hypothetical protein
MAEIQHLIDQMVDAGWRIKIESGGPFLGSGVWMEAAKGGSTHSRQTMHIEDAVVLLHARSAEIDGNNPKVNDGSDL